MSRSALDGDPYLLRGDRVNSAPANATLAPRPTAHVGRESAKVATASHQEQDWAVGGRGGVAALKSDRAFFLGTMGDWQQMPAMWHPAVKHIAMDRKDRRAAPSCIAARLYERGRKHARAAILTWLVSAARARARILGMGPWKPSPDALMGA